MTETTQPGLLTPWTQSRLPAPVPSWQLTWIMQARPRKNRPGLRLVEPISGPSSEDRAHSARPQVREVDETELIEDLLSASPKRANEFYRYLAPVVHAALYKVLGRVDEDHEDLVQTAFEQIARSITLGKYARECRLTTWASVIAARTGLMAIRSRRRLRRHQGPGLDDISVEQAELPTDVEGMLSARADLERVRQILCAMNEAQAVAVVLHDALGHDLREIAALLDITVSAAQSRLVRGRAEFMSRYGREEEHS